MRERSAGRFVSLEPADRFWAKVEMEPTSGCFIWMGKRKPNGYGVFWLDEERVVYAHRFAYELAKGPIPVGLQIDHLCRVRACVNASHLEAVSQQENLHRGEGIAAQHARKTHCKWGHHLALIGPLKWRRCQTCLILRRNAQRRPRVPQTHCKRGHPLTEAYVYSGVRVCRSCHGERVRKYLAKKRQ